jgi:hypothetical protein
VNNALTGLSLTSATICYGESATLTAAPAGAASYSLNGSTWQTANTFTVHPTATETYDLQEQSAPGCTGTLTDAATVTVNDRPTGLSLTPASAIICSGETVTLTAMPAGAASYSLDGSQWQTANTFTEHPDATQTYTLYIQSAAGCTASLENAATVTVNNLPAVPADASSNARCDAGTVTFSASVPGGVTIDWYDDATGGAIVPGGQDVTAFSPSLNTTATYYAQARDHTTGCVSATRLPVTATVTPTPKITTQPAGTVICSGGTVKLTVAASNATAYQWKKGSSNVSDGVGGQSATYTTAALTANATYSVVVYNNACSTVSNNAVVTVHTASTAPTALNASTTTVCSGSPVTLTASGGTLGTSASYQFGTGSTPLTSTTATTYTLSSVTATATYWVKIVTSSACAAPSGSPTRAITVNTAVGQATISGAASNTCPTTTVSLTASATGATTFTWYRNSSQVQTGTSRSYTVTSSGSYTVQGKNANCTGTTSSSKVVNIDECNEVPGCSGLKVYNTSAATDGKGTWSSANTYCANNNARLPTEEELLCMCNNAAYIPGGFAGWYWSSTASGSVHKYVISPGCTSSDNVKTDNGDFRCVL